jgi:putative ABC transport system ATP-binding protein
MVLIEAKDISKVYQLGDIELRALDRVSVTIEKGEFLAIMGPSGSGKSTFMNIIGCLDIPTDGQYLLEEVDVGKLTRDELAHIRNQKLGFVFQGFNLLPRTSALENVELPMLYNNVPLRERKEKAIAALNTVGLKQRVAIARAIVNQAPVILADEPTGNLDTHTSMEIMELFQKLNVESGITIILVTHEPDIAAYSRRTMRFLDGHLVSDKLTVDDQKGFESGVKR